MIGYWLLLQFVYTMPGQTAELGGVLRQKTIAWKMLRLVTLSVPET
jgi:hypothetical protein